MPHGFGFGGFDNCLCLILLVLIICCCCGGFGGPVFGPCKD